MKQPNIIMVFPDQFNSRALGFRGELPVKTPNLDEFASDALVLENAVSNYPLCSPYRGMLMSGRYPWKNGVTSNCNTARNAYGVYLKRDERCISDVLAENGYDVGYIGKWHLDPPEVKHLPYIAGYREQNAVWDSYTLKNRRHQMNFWHAYGAHDKHFEPHYWHNDDPVENVISPKMWSVEHETDVALDFINNKDNCRDENKPFMLFLAHNPPHNPYDETPQKYMDEYKDMSIEELLCSPNFMDSNPPELADEKDVEGGERAREGVRGYYGAVTGVDDHFGKIISTLKEKGIYDDTIVIFSSDHGDQMGSHNKMGKGSWFSESYKIPFIIRYPKKIKPGKTDFIMNVPDMMPTLLSLCGLEDKLPEKAQGDDKTAYMAGKEDDGTCGLYFQFGHSETKRGIKTKEYTFVASVDFADNETFYLYDDINDPYQLNEISKEKPELCKELYKQMWELLEKYEYNRP